MPADLPVGYSTAAEAQAEAERLYAAAQRLAGRFDLTPAEVLQQAAGRPCGPLAALLAAELQAEIDRLIAPSRDAATP